MSDWSPSPVNVENEAFWAALSAGDLDSSLSLLDTAPQPTQATAPLYCHLAAALLHRERAMEAAACCRHVFPLVRADGGLLRICAWVFSNAGCFAEATAAYWQIVALEPDWIEGYRHASSALAAAGRPDEAIAAALAASDRDPDNPEFALHAARLLSEAGRLPEAAAYLDRALPAAASVALTIDAAELLMRWEQPETAADLLRNAAAAAPEPRLLRVLSSAEMLCRQWPAALDAIDAAITVAPDVAEYHVHRAHLLRGLGEVSGAARALDEAARLAPGDAAVRRGQLSLYLEAGLVSEATAIGGDLLHRFPDDRPAAESVLHLLNHRLDTIEGEYVVLPGASAGRSRPVRPSPRWREQLAAQRRVIRALILRETRTRFGESKLGYGWALIEPIAHIALLSATFAVLMHGQPPIGRHFFLFYYTGLIPYHMFVHTSSGMSHAIIGNGPMLQLPPVTTFDVVAARGLLEIATDIVVALLLLIGFGAIGVASPPDDLWAASLALLTTAALGCGVGCVNAVMTVFCRSWERAFAQVTRLLYFISGIFYVPGMMPDWAREGLAWNPLLHAIDWFRAGFFAGYQPHWLDRSYLALAAVLSLMFGIALERGMRRRLRVPL